MSKLKNYLKNQAFLKPFFTIYLTLKDKYSLPKKIKLLWLFFLDYTHYRKINNNPNFRLEFTEIYPRLYDKTSVTPLDFNYFYQDLWLAKKIFNNKPLQHFDIGSKASLVSIIAQFTKTTMIDLRPLPAIVDNLSFIPGNILELPLAADSITSLSSMCVLEHVGLGRYGDKLDPFGSEKASQELKRVLAPNGNLYISVQIDNSNKVNFNAHRTFTREYILKLFEPLKLVEEKYVYGTKMYSNYLPENHYGTAMYHFKKS